MATFVALTFTISWGVFLLIVGPAGFPPTAEQFATLLPIAVGAMIIGPSVAGILLTAIIEGRPGLRRYRARLLTWQVGAGWYAALLLAPTLMLAVLLPLSLFSRTFVPGLFVVENTRAHVLFGVSVAVAAGIFEELGWSGFATPVLRRRYSPSATGLRLGLMWAFWHMLPAAWGSGIRSGPLALTSFLIDPFAFLVPFRVLMVWVYDRTDSLLLGILMHVSLTASAIILGAVSVSGPPLLIFDLVWCAAASGVVAVALPTAGNLHRPRDARGERRRPMPPGPRLRQGWASLTPRL
jgi:membrane protease YdiL (CAAX protease family)